MTPRTLFTAASAAMGLALAVPASAEEIVLQIPGIDGDSAVPGHADWIDIDSMGVDITRQTSTSSGGGGAGTPKAQFSDLVLVKEPDVASANLFVQAGLGVNLNTVTLHVVDTDTVPGTGLVTLSIKLNTSVISAFSVSATETGTPIESLALAFGKLYLTQTTYDSAGTVVNTDSEGWSQIDNLPWDGQ